MKRRAALRNIGLISAGVLFVPSCMQQENASIVLKNIPLIAGQEKLLRAICEAIIPATPDFVGSSDIKAHEFVLTMMDDCTAPEEQQVFNQGMLAFEEAFQKSNHTSFLKSDQASQQAFLFQLEENKEGEVLKQFYQKVKQYTVLAFTSCQPFMEGIRHYKIIPGSNFKGCVPMQAAS